MSGNGPAVLRLTLGTDRGSQMVVRASTPRGGAARDGWVVSVDPSDFGLPTQLTGGEKSMTGFRVPADLDGLVRVALDEAQGNLLCLQLVEPFGYLGLVPWEALLGQRYGVSVLRVPTVALERRVPRTSLQVAVLAAVPNEHRSGDVATRFHGTRVTATSRLTPGGGARNGSAPAGARRRRRHGLTAHEVDRVVRSILRGSPRQQTSVQVIATPWIYHDLRGMWRRRRGSSEWPVVLHDPFDLRNKVQQAKEDRGPLSQTPWLRTLKIAQGGEQADVVHMICHAHVSDASARLVLADPLSTSTNTASRYVSLNTLRATLDEVGAWALCLSSPGTDRTPHLRYVASRMTELRPGPIAVTDLEADPACAEVEAAYRFLFAPDPCRPPEMRHGLVTCDASQIEADVEVPVETMSIPVPTRPGEQPREATEALITDDTTPMWVAAAQRFVEQRQLDLARLESPDRTEPLSPEAAAIARGVRAALVAIQDALAARARKERDRDD